MSAHINPQRRVEGLRNLRRGYNSVVSAVGFWREIHGEDLIEEYASLVEKYAVLDQKLSDEQLLLMRAENRIEQLRDALQEIAGYECEPHDDDIIEAHVAAAYNDLAKVARDALGL